MVVGIFLDPQMMKYPSCHAMNLSPLHSLAPRWGDAKLSPPTQRRSPRPNSAWRKNTKKPRSGDSYHGVHQRLHQQMGMKSYVFRKKNIYIYPEVQ